MLYSSLFHWPLQNSAKLHGNVEILQKQANSSARLKIPCTAENCGPYVLLDTFKHRLKTHYFPCCKTHYLATCSLSLSLSFPVRGACHRPNRLQEVHDASWVNSDLLAPLVWFFNFGVLPVFTLYLLGVHRIQIRIRIRPDIRWIWWIRVGSGRPDLRKDAVNTGRMYMTMTWNITAWRMTIQNCIRKLTNSVTQVQYQKNHIKSK